MDKELRENMQDVLEMAYGYAGVKEKHNPVIDKLCSLILDEVRNAVDRLRPYNACREKYDMFSRGELIRAIDNLRGNDERES